MSQQVRSSYHISYKFLENLLVKICTLSSSVEHSYIEKNIITELAILGFLDLELTS